jgi:putative DNA primase/helicase
VFPVREKPGTPYRNKDGELVTPKPKTPYTPNGVKAATTDAAPIRKWWYRWPNAAVGIACGASCLAAIDVDVKDGKPGLESWRDLLEEHGQALADSLVSETPSGGLHIIYQQSKPPIGNTESRLAPGIDTRGVGGYIVAPPSVTPSGEYRWALGCGPQDREPAPFPEVLLPMLAKPEPPKPVGGRIAQGTRNSTLASLAGTMRRRGMSPDAIEAALMKENEKCDPPLPAGEVAAIARSVGRYAPAKKKAPEDIHRTDVGNALRLVAKHGHELRYCAPLGGWLVWDGKRWALDDNGQAARWAKDTIADLFSEAAAMPHNTKDEIARADELWRFACASQSASRQAAMLTLTQTELGIATRASDFDTDPWLLNVDNGTLDLRSGKLRKHNPSDMITKLAPVAYDPGAKHPVLDRYLADTTGGDADFATYLQRAAGYSLTGSTAEECFFMVLGPAATGKSTFVEALLAMMGDYALKASFDAFLEKRDVGGATPELARLRGARLVAATETEGARRLNHVAVKELTGGDSVTARNLYAAPFTFKPTCKLWLAANECPKLSDRDSGLWRRLQRLPFEHTLSEDQRDAAVKAALTGEALPALLAWAVAGCLVWQRSGLHPAPVVRAATVALRMDFDPLSEFFSEACVFTPKAETPGIELRQAYEQWAASNGGKAIGTKEWRERLEAGGCHKLRRRTGGGQATLWRGIGLVAESVQGVQENEKFRKVSYTSESQDYFSDFGQNRAHPAQNVTDDALFDQDADQGIDTADGPGPSKDAGEGYVASINPFPEGLKHVQVSRARIQELVDQGYTRADATYVSLAEAEPCQ